MWLRKQHACTLSLALFHLCVALAADNVTKPEGGVERLPGGEPNLCSCAVVNFYDRDSGRDFSDCCAALNLLCQTNNTLACGHVFRFCGEAQSGYSAWVLDQFVRDGLTELSSCGEFNLNATHDEPCGNGWCRIGYKCKKVEATRCREKKGIHCGPGYCRFGSTCNSMSSEVCVQVKQDELQAMNLTNAVESDECRGGLCTVCEDRIDHLCSSQQGDSSPCMGRGCADGLVCGAEDEFVCSLRQGAFVSLSGDVVREHTPEKVPENKLRRSLKAVVLPTLGILSGVICSIALISWVTLHVKRARKEAADQAEEDRKNRRRFERANSAASSIHDEKHPLSARRQPTIRVASPRMLSALSPRRLGFGTGRAEGSASSQPSSGRRSAREAPRRPRGSRTHYRSVSDVDVDGISCLPGEGIATVNTGYQASRTADRTRSRPVDIEKGVFPGDASVHHSSHPEDFV